MRATELAHKIVSQAVNSGDNVADATIGNGHDTLFLAKLVGPTGHVYGFDIQKAAILATSERVKAQSNVTLIHCGHERLDDHLPQHVHNNLAAVMFNLGYLPGGGKNIVTKTSTTLQALNTAATNLKLGGIISLILYRGHMGGDEEANAVRVFAKNLSPAFETTLHDQQPTQSPAPELITINRLR